MPGLRTCLAARMVFAVAPVQVCGPAVVVRVHQLMDQRRLDLLPRPQPVVANHHLRDARFSARRRQVWQATLEPKEAPREPMPSICTESDCGIDTEAGLPDGRQSRRGQVTMESCYAVRTPSGGLNPPPTSSGQVSTSKKFGCTAQPAYAGA